MSKVFGIGLSRTGTKSLAAALNLLGIRTRYAITETSAVPFYPHFDELYPGSKFILTIRDKQSWLNSCGEHWGDANAPLPLPDTGSLARCFGNFIDLIVYGSFRFNERRWSYVFDRQAESPW